MTAKHPSNNYNLAVTPLAAKHLPYGGGQHDIGGKASSRVNDGKASVQEERAAKHPLPSRQLR
jgi:hypothetical protein